MKEKYILSMSRDEALKEAKSFVIAISERTSSDMVPEVSYGALRAKLGPWKDLLPEVLSEAEYWGVRVI